MARPLRTGIGLLLSLLAASTSPVPGQGRETGRWQPAGSLSVGRYAPAGVLLPDGRCLIAGGYSFETNRTHRSSELFDPGQDPDKAWNSGPEMALDRNFPVAVPLPGGGALFSAGFRVRTGTTASTEHLQLTPLRFRTGEPLQQERELFSVTRLHDGRFLLAGGFSTRRGRTLDSAEIFDPLKGSFVLTEGPLLHARFGHTGVLLPDGKVLIVGGKVLGTNDDVLPAELYDPATGRFTETGKLQVGRDRCTAWPVQMAVAPEKEKRDFVLIAGGSAKEGGTLPARRCELYDPVAGSFRPGPELLTDRMAHTATPLAGSRVLLVGGWSGSENRTTPRAELWSPTEQRFLPAGTLQVGRHDHVSILLKGGRVLVAGGKEAPARAGVETPTLCELWSPE